MINNFCQLMDPAGVKEELQHLRSLNVDGVVVECWWGIVEAWTPKKFEWAGYREMFNIIREFGMKLQVTGRIIISFHFNIVYDFLSITWIFVCIVYVYLQRHSFYTLKKFSKDLFYL